MEKNFMFCDYCNKSRGRYADHSLCSKELQKRPHKKSYYFKGAYKSEKRIVDFIKSMGMK